jgi:signal transduction histidine kinase
MLKGLGGAEFALLGDEGRVLSSTLGDHLATADFPRLPEHLVGWRSGSDLSFARTWSHGGIAYQVALLDRAHSSPSSGPQRLLVLLPETTLSASAWEAHRAVLVLSLVGAFLAALLASWIGRALSRPLSAILRTIRQIGQGDLRPEGLPRDRHDEIGELAGGVAKMARWLQRLHDEQVQTERLRLIRQVSAGLAHELRNPLTAARMTLQFYAERNWDRDTEPLRVALTELARMERQVRRFLQIARPEPPRFEVADLGPVLDRTTASLAATAERRGSPGRSN